MKITLGEYALLADRPIVWANRPGTEPSFGEFDCTPQAAAGLLSKRGPLSLIVDRSAEGGVPFRIDALYALHEVPSTDPARRRVRVFDHRWFWPAHHICADFNKRRRAGFFRIQADDVPELERVEEKFAYAKYSAKDRETPFTALEITYYLLNQIALWEGTQGGELFTFSSDEHFRKIAADVVVEDIELDDTAPAALSRVLATMPEALLLMNPDGSMLLTTQTSGLEAAMYRALGPEVVGGGHVISISHYNECPPEIHVLASIEAEVRFDYTEPNDTDTYAADPDEESRTLRNVLPQPDYQLQIGGKIEAQGTYHEYAPYMAALGATPNLGIPAITFDLLRQASMPFMDLWADILALGKLDTDHDWSARVSALSANFRRTMRLPRGWMDRAKQVKAIRVATVNQSTGSRAPASVYSDWSQLGGQRSQLRNWADGDALAYAVNNTGYSATINLDTKPAPAVVILQDEGIGILNFDYRIDPNRVYEMVMPGKIELDGMPSAQKASAAAGGRNKRSLTFDSIKSSGGARPKLATGFKSATIITMSPGAPNSAARLYRIVVKPGDIQGMVPARVVQAARNGRGPIREERLGAGVETARLRWRDDRVADIEKLFGIREGKPDLGGLCVNSTGRGTPVNIGQAGANGIQVGQIDGASLDRIARTIAARIWSSYADHLGGSATGDLNVDILPQGRASAVEHTIQPNGIATTRLAIPSERPPEFSFHSILDASTRRVIFRQINGAT